MGLRQTTSGPRDDLPSGTKRLILDLIVRQELGAEDLAARLAITGAAVRQHLANLTEAGLVERGRAGSGPGRPAYVYRLSALARRAYPKRYDVLAAELVEVLIERHGQAAALELVEKAARRVAERALAAFAAGTFAGAPEEERWDRVFEWLEEIFDWEADWAPTPAGGRRIVVHRCPFHDVAADRPAVCGRFFTTLLATLTDREAVAHAPIGDGFRCCALEL